MVITDNKSATDEIRTSPIALRANYFWTTLGSVVFGATNVGMQMALAKMGTPKILGEYVLGVSVVQPVMMLAQLNLRAVQCTDTQREYRFPHYFWLRTSLVLLALAIIGVLAGTGPYGTMARAVILMTGIGTTFDGIGDIVYGAYQQGQRMDRMGISMTVKGLLSLILLIAFFHYGHTAVWAVAGSALASVLVVTFYDIPCGWWYARATGNAGVKVTARSMVNLGMLALPLGITVFFASLWTNFPRYFLVKAHDVSDLSYLAAPSTAMTLGIYIVSILGQPIIPRLATYAASGDRAGFFRLFAKLAACVWLVGGTVVAVSVLFGRQLITVLFKGVYANHIDVFLWMMVAAALSYAALVCGTGITAARWFKSQIFWTGSVALVSFAASWILVPRLGILGVAEAVCATMVARLIIGYGLLAWAIYSIGREKSPKVADAAA